MAPGNLRDMARKLTIYRLDPANPEDRSELGSFELGEDGQLRATFKNAAFEWEIRQGIFDAENHRLVSGAEGPRFMELLERSYGPKSFIAVERG